MTILYTKSGAHDEPARGLSTSQTNKQTNNQSHEKENWNWVVISKIFYFHSYLGR